MRRKRRREEDEQEDRNRTNPFQDRDEDGGVDLRDDESPRNEYNMRDLDDPSLDEEDDDRDIMDDDGDGW